MDVDKGTGPAPTATDERTIGQLVADISNQMSGLVKAEIELAKAEVKADVTKGGIGAGLLAGAVFFALNAFVLLCFAGAYGLVAAGLVEWAAFLVMTGVLLIIAAVLALVGRGRLQQVSAPKRTIDTAKDSVEAIKGHSTSA